MKTKNIFFISILSLFIAACGGGGGYVIKSPEDNVKVYKVGRPYKIAGKWHHPKPDPYYDEVGIASWYGPNFHGNKTANGEVFNRYAMTAAHKTLPLPSVVKVTNVQSGHSVNLRVNDRGPFVGNRIIDLSEAAASALGVKNRGTAKVRVQFLPYETAALFPEGSHLQQKTLAHARQRYLASIKPAAKKPGRTNKIHSKQALSNVAKATAIRSVEVKNLGSLKPSKRPQRIFVQAASYQNPDSAYNAAKKLKTFGSAEVKSSVINGQDFYRVRVGPVRSAKTADKLLSQLTNFGFNNAFIISD